MDIKTTATATAPAPATTGTTTAAAAAAAAAALTNYTAYDTTSNATSQCSKLQPSLSPW